MKNDKNLRKMILEIVLEIDYDIYKECYNLETAEEPEWVEDNIKILISIVQKYLKGEK